MRRPVENKSKTLEGVTDLSLAAPIRRDLIDALDTRTYETRLRILLRALGAMRKSSRELAPIRPFSDTVERIGGIHAFRLSILDFEPEPMLVLSVSFDGGWEPYMRVIWRELGILLDVIFCNCRGYVTAHDNTFAKYIKWVRSAQLETAFFYADSAQTVVDLHYLRQTERLAREIGDRPTFDPGASRLVAADPEDLALRALRNNLPEAVQQGLTALVGLYRLADFYPPDGPDGPLLLRATQQLLKEMPDTRRTFPNGHPVRERFRPQLEWFETNVTTTTSTGPASGPNLSDIQGGILTGYDATHAALLLISCDDAAAARAFLGQVHNDITTESGARARDTIYTNIALTLQGLRLLGVPEDKLETLPVEFREGMEARAGVLGDYRCNHPRNWSLPERNWFPAGHGAHAATRVQLSMVHFAVQLSIATDPFPNDCEIVGNQSHPLFASVEKLAALRGVRVLSVQAMRREVVEVGNERFSRDHFGFVDGISQPKLGNSGRGAGWNDQVRWGEVFLERANDSGDPPPEDGESDPLLRDGTYLVIRKLRQDVAALDEVLERASTALTTPPEHLKAKMMGRTLDGAPLAAPAVGPGNAFDYSGDTDGSKCPFQAHVRRANPRTAAKPIVPRIMRRGMSYGPRFDESHPAAGERGLMFMAYNANIAEQFEVIQRWISGGNSSNVFSGQSDPFLGVPQRGNPRTFRFEDGGIVKRFDLDPADDRPFVQLEWGLYLFVPSLPALDHLQSATAGRQQPWSTEQEKRGEAIIQSLLALDKKDPKGAVDRWKGLFEDLLARLSNTSAGVWAAIRQNHGGVLRTPYGVVVARKNLALKVFEDHASNYSVSGYLTRMKQSFGEIYLGLDAGPRYAAESTAVNTELMKVKEADAFRLAREKTHEVLQTWASAARPASVTIDIKELADAVLASLCVEWFGVPDDTFVKAGAWHWNWKASDPPRCPGHFDAPSRYMFQPRPGPKASTYGQDHGQALQAAVLKLVSAWRTTPPSQHLVDVMLKAFPSDDDLVARTLIGVLMGFLPTVDGNLQSSLNEWITDGTLWDLQEAYLSDPDPDAHKRAQRVLRDPLRRTMQLRPVPEVVWRTAVKDHQLGNVDVKRDDVVVVAIVSATQEGLATTPPDVTPIFGGNRRAATQHTHACPAYDMGMGVLLGFITALVETGPLSPGLGALTLSWTP